MSKFVPVFTVANVAGQFLAVNPKKGRSQLPCVWTRNRAEAATFNNWMEAAQFGMTLPTASQRNAGIIDQNDSVWNDDRARKAKVFYPAKPKPEAGAKPSVEAATAPAANDTNPAAVAA